MQQQPTPANPPVTKAKKATAGFALSLISGILVLIDSVIRVGMGRHLLTTEFYRAEFLRLFGAVGFVFGIIILVGAILIYLPGKAMIGGIIVLIFSVLSIVSGGGFIVGLILGVIGAILTLMKKQ